MSSDRPLRRALDRFLRSEAGSISTWSLFLFLAGGAIAATAVDVTHLASARTELQVSADLAAHAALFRRTQGATTAQAARNDAIRAVHYSMPTDAYGLVIEASDISFGTYDRASDIFRVDPDARTAVLVTTAREEGSGNAAPGFFFRLVGIDQIDVSASSVVETYVPECVWQGFLANGEVDVRSGNLYTNGFCMHSQECVDMNNGNTFGTNTIVSMPNLDCFWVGRNQAQTFAQNPGLQQALREANQQIKELDLIRPGAPEPFWTQVQQAGSYYRPSYITASPPPRVDVSSNRDVLPEHIAPNAINHFDCTGDQTLRFRAGSTDVFQNFVLLTDCKLQFAGTLTLQNAIVYTTSDSSDSVQATTAGGGGSGSGSGGFNLGRPETPACQAGGGATILTRGGFKNSAAMMLNGSKIIALKDIEFSANANGWGASIISDDDISGTSNMIFNGCTTGSVGTVTAPYLRLAR